jgi:N utilization substance protein B
VYKDAEDKAFVKDLFLKTILNESELKKNLLIKHLIGVKRIAEVDTIILKMAICEFLKFPSIPVKVT